MSAQYVREYYGVDYKRGDWVTVDGHPGVIVSFPGQYLGVRFDGEKRTRSCTLAPNANSMLYAAAWRAAKALGYQRLITYTLASESGSSLRAAGYRVVAERGPRRGWSVPSRPRLDLSTGHGVQRTLWEATGAEGRT